MALLRLLSIKGIMIHPLKMKLKEVRVYDEVCSHMKSPLGHCKRLANCSTTDDLRLPLKLSMLKSLVTVFSESKNKKKIKNTVNYF